MADKHEQGVKQVISDFTVNREGRLAPYTVGTFKSIYGERVTKVGKKGHPDVVGRTWGIGQCVYVEVKTIAYPYCSRDQFFFLENAHRDNCVVFIFMEVKGGGWKRTDWSEARKRYLKKWGW